MNATPLSPGVVAIVLAGGASSRFGSDKLAALLDGRPLLHHALDAVGTIADRIVVVIAPGASPPSVPYVLASRVAFARDATAHGGPLAGLGSGLAASLALAASGGSGDPVGLAASGGLGDPVGLGASGGISPSVGLTASGGLGASGGPGDSVGLAASAALPAPVGLGATARRAPDSPGRDRAPRITLVVGGDMPTLVPAVLRLLVNGLAADPELAAMTLEASHPSPLPMAVRPGAALAAIDQILGSTGRRSLRALLDFVPSATLPATSWRALDPAGVTLRDVDTPADIRG